VQDLKNFTVPPEFRGRSSFVVQLWWVVQSTLFGCSPQFMYAWRRFLLRFFGAKIGKSVIIRPTARITYPWNLTIGDYSWVGDDVCLYTLGKINIGQNAVISQRSYLCTGTHDYRSNNFDIVAKPIFIEESTWVATDVYIAPGVTIGRGAVVGARSSVYSNIPPEMICIGSPAKPIKHRFGE